MITIVISLMHACRQLLINPVNNPPKAPLLPQSSLEGPPEGAPKSPWESPLSGPA